MYRDSGLYVFIDIILCCEYKDEFWYIIMVVINKMSR